MRERISSPTFWGDPIRSPCGVSTPLTNGGTVGIFPPMRTPLDELVCHEVDSLEVLEDKAFYGVKCTCGRYIPISANELRTLVRKEWVREVRRKTRNGDV